MHDAKDVGRERFGRRVFPGGRHGQAHAGACGELGEQPCALDARRVSDCLECELAHGKTLGVDLADEADDTAPVAEHRGGEPLGVPDHPLDVLCQQLLGLAASGVWTAAEAFAFSREFPRRA